MTTSPTSTTSPRQRHKYIATYDIETYPYLFVANVRTTDPENPTKTYVINSNLASDFSITILTLRQQINKVIKPLLDLTSSIDYLFVGYNSISFDDCVIRRLRELHNEFNNTPIHLQEEIPTEYFTKGIHDIANTLIHNSYCETSTNLRQSPSMPHSLDLFTLLSPMPSLKKVEIRTRFHNVQDLPYAPDHSEPFTKEQEEEIINYCWNDVDATYQLYLSYGQTAHYLRRSLQELFHIKEPLLESLSEPQTAEQTMLRLYSKKMNQYSYQIREEAKATKGKYLDNKTPIQLNSVIPDLIAFETCELDTLLTELKSMSVPITNSGHPNTAILERFVTIGDTVYKMGGGGLHSVDTPAVITPSSPEHQLIDVDVASYYPAILINHKLHPEHLTVGFAEVYEGIRDERIRIKRAGQKLEKELIRLRKELAELT
ncbi:MAG: hypothetical protein HOE82_08570 [Gammaproteobacteria bacterium]|nr:hypothetical protein [Gammaproteobacteria bacterium]